MRSPVYWIDYDGQITSQRGNGGNPCIKVTVAADNGSLTVHRHVDVLALVDTGSDTSLFFPKVFETVQCGSGGKKELHGNWGKGLADVFRVVLLPEGLSTFLEVEASTITPVEQKMPYSGLVGRDVLQYGKLILDDASGRSEIIWGRKLTGR